MCVAIGRNDFTECRAVFNTALRIQSILGGVALVATFAIAAATPLFTHVAADAHLFRDVVIILGASTALSFPTKVYGGVLDAQYRFDINASLAILGSLLAHLGHFGNSGGWWTTGIGLDDTACVFAGGRATDMAREARSPLGQNRN